MAGGRGIAKVAEMSAAGAGCTEMLPARTRAAGMRGAAAMAITRPGEDLAREKERSKE